ncbi:MAG TPA: hypothetical protein VKX25_00600 [Bryobacteraceae bacterium]|nr:hypothetical protein [Bryobacteraceae bacterium]
MAQILEFSQLRAGRSQTNETVCCYCDAARTAREHFAGQLKDLYRTSSKPRVLCLETLEGGIPAIPGGWDLIYSASFFNSLPNPAARQVVKSAVARLGPSGRLLIANVRPEVRLERCPLCQKSGSIHRGEIAMIELAKDLPADSVTGQLIFRDRLGLNTYLELHKNATVLAELLPLRKIG